MYSSRLEELYGVCGVEVPTQRAAAKLPLHLEPSSSSSSGLCDNAIPAGYNFSVLSTPPPSTFSGVALSILISVRDVRQALVSSFRQPAAASASSSASSSLPEVLSFVTQTTRRVTLLRSRLEEGAAGPQETAHRSKICEALTFELDSVTRLFKALTSYAKKGEDVPRLTTGGSGRGQKRARIRKFLLGDEERMLVEEGARREGFEDDEEGAFEEAMTGWKGRRVEFGSFAAATDDDGDDARPAAQRLAAVPTPTQATSKREVPSDLVPTFNAEAFEESLALEGSILAASLHSELDAAEEMERQTTQIANLLTSFTNLVQQQSEQIGLIEETTKRAKEEVEKGGEELVTAKERNEKAGYTVPLIIAFLAWSLLFVNWITP